LDGDVTFAEKVKRYFGADGNSSKEVFPPPQSADDIKAYLIARLRKRLRAKPGLNLTEETPFDQLGMDSLALVRFSGELEEWLNVEIEPALLIEYSNVRELSLALDKLRLDACHGRSGDMREGRSA
jgi:acyl carrier protein